MAVAAELAGVGGFKLLLKRLGDELPLRITYMAGVREGALACLLLVAQVQLIRESLWYHGSRVAKEHLARVF